MTPTNAAIPSTRRHGLTLIELVVSLVASSALLAGIGSSLYIAAQATDPQLGGVQGTVDGSQMLFDLAAELEFAQSFTERTATSVEFTVADRDADTVPETIRYAWSGIVGDPLTRQYNGGSMVNVVEDVHEFDLNYDLDVVTQPVSPDNESAETLLTQETTEVSPMSKSEITSTKWRGQYFHPNDFNVTPLPADTISWKVAKVEIVIAQIGGPGGQIAVQLRDADGNNLPVSASLGEKVINESSLPTSYAWHTVTFDAPIAGLTPTQDLCLIFKYQSGSGEVADLQIQNAPSGLVKTSDSGVIWTYNASRRLRYKIYGTVTTPGPPADPDLYYLTRVGITLRVGADSRSRVDTGTNVLNRPEVSGP